MVAVPAVLQTADMAKLCVSLWQPNETISMTITLMSQEDNTTIFQMISREEFHTCIEFEVRCRDGL